MTFDEKWKEVEQLKILPSTAIKQVPQALSEKTKVLLKKRTPQEIAELVGAAVDEIDHGSVETLDVLVRKRL